MSVNDDGDDPVGEFVESCVDGMITGWYLFVTFIAPDGSPSYWGDTMQGQTAFTSLGMAEAVAALERSRIIDNDHDDDNEGMP